MLYKDKLVKFFTRKTQLDGLINVKRKTGQPTGHDQRTTPRSPGRFGGELTAMCGAFSWNYFKHISGWTEQVSPNPRLRRGRL